MEIQNETNRYIWVDNKKSFIQSMHLLSPNYLLVIGDIKMNMIQSLLPRGLQQSRGTWTYKRVSTPKYFMNYNGNMCGERGKTFQFCHNRIHRKSIFLKLCVIKENKPHFQHSPHPFIESFYFLKSYL